jgi:hypothetical protein
MFFEKLREKDQSLTKCGLFLVNIVLKSQLCQPSVIHGVVRLGIFLVQMSFSSHPAVYQLSGIYLSDFDVFVLARNSRIIWILNYHVTFCITCSWCDVDASSEIMVNVLRDLLKIGCSFENL